MNESRTEIEKYLFLIRDPYGKNAISKSTMPWRPEDTENWTPAAKREVEFLFGFDPTDPVYAKETGLFFLEA